MDKKIRAFLREQATKRFLEYVRIDTQSDPDSKMSPSSEGQWLLGRILREEIIELGLEDVELDAHCYVYATLPGRAGCVAPPITFCAHLDTSSSESGANVRPIIVEKYDGSDIRFPGSRKKHLTTAESRELLQFVAKQLFLVTDGPFWVPMTKRVSPRLWQPSLLLKHFPNCPIRN